MTAVQQMTVVSHSQGDWEKFNLNEEDARSVSFFSKDGDVLSCIFFGKTNALQGRVAFRTWTKPTVFEMQETISNFVTASISFWSDPFIYPQCVSGYTRQKSEALLRHGRILKEEMQVFNTPSFQTRVLFENGSAADFFVYESGGEEKDFIVRPVFFPSSTFAKEEQAAVQNIQYCYKISAFTFERFLEEVTLTP